MHTEYIRIGALVELYPPCYFFSLGVNQVIKEASGQCVSIDLF